jgi:hypothetical protein
MTKAGARISKHHNYFIDNISALCYENGRILALFPGIGGIVALPYQQSAGSANDGILLQIRCRSSKSGLVGEVSPVVIGQVRRL